MGSTLPSRMKGSADAFNSSRTSVVKAISRQQSRLAPTVRKENQRAIFVASPIAFEVSTAEIDSGSTASKRFVPPSRPNHRPSAPYRLAPIRFAPRSSVPSRFAFCRFERTRLTPRKFAIERSAPARFVRCRCAPCKFTPVRSALAKFTPQRSALTPDSPPDSTQILCWSRISARSRSEIPMESPPLKTSAPAGFSVAISLFNSSISLIASISRPIRTISPRLSLPAVGHPCALQPLELAPLRFSRHSNSWHSKHGSNSPSTAVLLLGCLHPLLPALWKSPDLKYRRRRGNGGRSGGRRSQRIRTRWTQQVRNIHRRKGRVEKIPDPDGYENSAGVASLRGQGTPAYPARLRSERARNSSRIFPNLGPRNRSRIAAGR